MPFLFVCFGWGIFVYFLLKCVCVVAMAFIFTISKFSISTSDATLYWLL